MFRYIKNNMSIDKKKYENYCNCIGLNKSLSDNCKLYTDKLKFYENKKNDTKYINDIVLLQQKIDTNLSELYEDYNINFKNPVESARQKLESAETEFNSAQQKLKLAETEFNSAQQKLESADSYIKDPSNANNPSLKKYFVLNFYRPLHAGSNKIRILGRSRTIITKNNKQYINYKNELITLAAARKLDKSKTKKKN